MVKSLVVAENLHLEYPTRILANSVSLGVHEGDRIGIVGRNGDGKSSLLAMLARTLAPDNGRVTHRGGLRFGLLSQDDNLDDAATVEASIVGQRAEHEWAADPRIRDVIGGLVADLPWQGRIGELSGGQRRRVALAALLVHDWDVIALDEPTNHLDMHAIAWLAEHVRNRWANNTGALLVVTHDRWFLDAACTLTWEVHDGIVDTYEGGYAAYILQRVERARIAAATEQKRQNLMRKELAWLRRGAPARTSKPKFRIEAANQLIADVPEIRNPIELKRLAVARLGKDVIDLEAAGVTYPVAGAAGDATLAPAAAAAAPETAPATPGAGGAVEVLRDVTWRIAPGERTGILGANGAGKSTLLGLVCGTLAPTRGRVKIGKTVRIGLLDQQFSQLADIGGDRVRDVLARTKTSFAVEGKELSPAQLLERLGFDRAHLATYVRDLSGGQKRRLQLLLLLLAEPNVIVLDEPTNDVDHEMLTALEDLLDSWPGTLIVVSHDRYLMERITDQQYAIINGRLRHLPGGVEQYLQLTETAGVVDDGGRGEAAPTGPSGKAGMAGSRGPAGGNCPSEAAATAPALSGAQRFAAQKECAALERKIAKWEQEIAALDESMAAEPDYQKLQELGDRRRTLEHSIAAAEEKWLELSEQAAL